MPVRGGSIVAVSDSNQLAFQGLHAGETRTYLGELYVDEMIDFPTV